jgi:hypothetical protein
MGEAGRAATSWGPWAADSAPPFHTDAPQCRSDGGPAVYCRQEAYSSHAICSPFAPSGRPTRSPASSGSFIGASPTWPGVSRTTSSRPWPSTAAWIFVLGPPCDRRGRDPPGSWNRAARILVLASDTFGDGRALKRPHDGGNRPTHQPIDPAGSIDSDWITRSRMSRVPFGSETMIAPF